jgi:Na+-transporting NADH:ubiquinone oxidoreductase subunit B
MAEATASSSVPARSAAARRRVPLLQKQPAMSRMLLALAPVAASAVYFFGWRALVVLAVCSAVGFGTEWITARRRGKGVSTACLVTCWLYALSLPPTVPFWVAAVGIVVAILFAKEVFGGFGRNFANPAITGRAFVYLCFPSDLTGRFVPAFKGFPGGLAHWSLASLDALPDYLAGAAGQAGRTVADAVTQASPMWVSREYGFEVLRGVADGRVRGASLADMLLGSIGGTFHAPGEAGPRILAAGSLGEGCALLIALAAVYLLVTKTANWRLMGSGLAGLVLANVLFRNVLGFAGLGEVPPVAWQLLSGTTMYAVVFMITDPVSAPKKRAAQFAYGGLIGFLIVLLRWRGIFVAAATFSILLGNLVGPLLDLAAGAWEARRKARAAAGEEPAR